MIFSGNGLIWYEEKNKIIVNFNKLDTYETKNKQEIALLLNCPNVKVVGGNESTNNNIEKDEIIIKIDEDLEKIDDRLILTNDDMKLILDKSGIKYRSKATKDELEKLIEGQ